MAAQPHDVVTGALGFTGQAVARRLLDRGRRVTTLTGQPQERSPFGDVVRAVPFQFDRPAELTAALWGADTLYNTYWVRFEYGDVTFARAVENTKRLLEGARAAGVRRIVHVSIAKPEAAPDLPYYRGKAELEAFLRELGVSYAIVRPTVIFGGAGILINNIAWLLRRSPVFLVPGRGDYAIQPIHVDDMADLMVAAGGRAQNEVIDAVGPETYSFRDLVVTVRDVLRVRSVVVSSPPGVALLGGKLFGWWVGDVVLTRDEVRGLMAGLLAVDGAPTGQMRLSAWLASRAGKLGQTYQSEVGRHYAVH
jgi:uncharacterized protein YbjT (DUF2867 family)